jgi:hypothetical protein
LKIGIEYLHFRNPNWTKEYNRKKRSGEEEEKVLKYEQYAYMVWNLCETIFDRKKIDKNWVPVINLERGLHYEWFKQNNDKFKPQFCRFIDDYKSDDPPSMRLAAAKSYILFGAIISFLLIAAVLIVPAQFERIEYYDHQVEIECAKNQLQGI